MFWNPLHLTPDFLFHSEAQTWLGWKAWFQWFWTSRHSWVVRARGGPLKTSVVLSFLLNVSLPSVLLDTGPSPFLLEMSLITWAFVDFSLFDLILLQQFFKLTMQSRWTDLLATSDGSDLSPR